MDMTKKIKILLVKHDMTALQLSEVTGISQSNLSKKMNKNKFSIEDLEKIAKAFNATYEGYFALENGDKF